MLTIHIPVINRLLERQQYWAITSVGTDLAGKDQKESWCESTKWRGERRRLEYEIDVKCEMWPRREWGHSSFLCKSVFHYRCSSAPPSSVLGKSDAPQVGLSLRFWSSEAQGNYTSKWSGYANFRPKEEENTGDGFKMSLNQNNSGSTRNWQN